MLHASYINNGGPFHDDTFDLFDHRFEPTGCNEACDASKTHVGANARHMMYYLLYSESTLQPFPAECTSAVNI